MKFTMVKALRVRKFQAIGMALYFKVDPSCSLSGENNLSPVGELRPFKWGSPLKLPAQALVRSGCEQATTQASSQANRSLAPGEVQSVIEIRSAAAVSSSQKTDVLVGSQKKRSARKFSLRPNTRSWARASGRSADT
jgi:hypothetical protein